MKGTLLYYSNKEGREKTVVIKKNLLKRYNFNSEDTKYCKTFTSLLRMIDKKYDDCEVINFGLIDIY